MKGISLSTIGLVIGSILSVVGFYAYFSNNPTLNLAGFFYGIPLLLGGLALKAAELKPIPFKEPTPTDIVQLREQQATAIQNQLRKDITRYRYGQKAHLDEALSKLGLSPTDEERPVITSLQETKTNGNYTLILEFDSPLIPLEKWQEKQPKIEKFFGPGIQIQIQQPRENKIQLALISHQASN